MVNLEQLPIHQVSPTVTHVIVPGLQITRFAFLLALWAFPKTCAWIALSVTPTSAFQSHFSMRNAPQCNHKRSSATTPGLLGCRAVQTKTTRPLPTEPPSLSIGPSRFASNSSNRHRSFVGYSSTAISLRLSLSLSRKSLFLLKDGPGLHLMPMPSHCTRPCLVFQHAKSCGSFGHEARRLDAREESRPLGKERRTGPGRVDV